MAGPRIPSRILRLISSPRIDIPTVYCSRARWKSEQCWGFVATSRAHSSLCCAASRSGSSGSEYCPRQSEVLEGKLRWVSVRRAFQTSAARRWPARTPEKNEDERGCAIEKPSSSRQATPKPRITQILSSNLASKIKLTALSHENIYTLPNILTFSRFLAAPAIGYLVLHDQHLFAVALFAYAGLTDLLDGYLARRLHSQTVVGSVVDPMADKTLMTVLVGCLAVKGTLPLPLAVLILGRDVSLAIAAIYYRYASLPAPKTLHRYWDFSLPSAEVHPTTISKYNTLLQLILIGSTLTLPLLLSSAAPDASISPAAEKVAEVLGGPQGVETIIRAMQTVVATTTVWSGLSYVFSKRAVTILGTDEVLKKKQGHRGRMIIAGSFGVVLALTGWLAWKDWRRDLDTEINKKDVKET